MASTDGKSSHLSDERLVQIEASAVAHEADVEPEEIADIVAELRWRRREMRKDSKMAEELRRIRWHSETAVTKIEQFERKLEADRASEKPSAEEERSDG